MKPLTHNITVEDEGTRIDRWLSGKLASESRNRIQQLIKNGDIRVNGSQVKTSYKLHFNDQVLIHLPEPEPLNVAPEQIPLDIVFEDGSVIVVNKPRGMVVHRHRDI